MLVGTEFAGARFLSVMSLWDQGANVGLGWVGLGGWVEGPRRFIWPD